MKDIKKISRTKIELFLDCPRCFWLDIKYKIKRPEKFKTTSIGSKYDPILKKEFDDYRKNGKNVEEFENLGFRLYNNIEKLIKWRKELSFYHKDHNVTYYGKIDDLLIDRDENLIVLDFKTTLSKEINIYEDYKRQLELYGYFLKKINESVHQTGVLYYVQIDFDENYQKIERREVKVLNNLDFEIYDEVLEKLFQTYCSEKEPKLNPNCEFCQRDLKVRWLNF